MHNKRHCTYLKAKSTPHPRKNFIHDLLKLITTVKEDDQDVILLEDFNEVVGDDPKMMARILVKANLTDVHAHKHGHANTATYIRGRRRVYDCFVSPRILKHVLRCEFEVFHTRKVCDHRGYFLDLSMRGLFDRRLPAIVNPAEQCIRSNQPRLVIRKYLLKLAKYLKEHNIEKKIIEIQVKLS